MLELISERLAPEMIFAGAVLLGLLAFLAASRPDVCIAMVIPAYIFLGLLKDLFPISVSAGTAIFPLAVISGAILRGDRFRFGHVEKAMIGLGLVIVCSLYYTTDLVYGSEKAALFCFLVLPIVVLIPNVINSPRSLRLVIRVSIWTFVIYVLINLLLQSKEESIRGRFAAIGDVTGTAQVLGLAALVCLLHLILGKTDIVLRWFLACIALMGMLLLFMTGTRAAFLSLVLSLLFAYWFVGVDGARGLLRRESRGAFILVIGIPFVCGGWFILLDRLPEDVFSRFTSLATFFSSFESIDLSDPEYSSDRAMTFGLAARAFREHPLAGVGAGGYKTVLTMSRYGRLGGAHLLDDDACAYPHNIVLEFACEQGMPGLILILYVIYLNFKIIRRLRHAYCSDLQGSHIICLCSTIYFYGLCLSMTALDVPKMMILWWGMGLLLAADRIYRQSAGISLAGQTPRKGNYLLRAA